MKKAFLHTGQYDGMIAMTMAHVAVSEGALARTAAKPQSQAPQPPAPSRPRDLRYGENPHQRAAWISPPPDSRKPWDVHQGKELSYTNLLDLDAALRIVLEFTEPGAAVIKHTNPCGVATGDTIDAAYVRARDADALSAFGGIVGLNRTIDAQTARALTGTFIEAVIAPAVDDEARAILAAKQNMRVVTRTSPRVPAGGRETCRRCDRSWRGPDQESDRVTEARVPWPDGRCHGRHSQAAHPDEWIALRFAWRVCAQRKVEHRRLHRAGPDARDRRRTDEPCGRRQGGGMKAGESLAGLLWRPTRSSRFETAWTPWRPRGQPPSYNRAAPCATPR